jgi:recombination protein RecA
MGLPAGRPIEIIGEEQVGKTAIVSAICAAVQRLGGSVWWNDAEGKFDMDLGRKAGLVYDADQWRYDQPKYLEIFQTALEENIVALHGVQKDQIAKGETPPPAIFVLDSLAMLGVHSISTKRVHDQAKQPMSVAQQWTHFYQRETIKLFGHLHCYLVFINHLRDNPDLAGFGGKSQFKSPGGKANKYMQTIRIFLSQTKFNETNDDLFFDQWEKKDSEYGYNLDMYVEKNSAGAPWRKARLPFFFHKGFDDPLGCLQYLRNKGYLVRYVLQGKQFSKEELLYRSQHDPEFQAYLQQLCCYVYQLHNSYSSDDFQINYQPEQGE